MAFRSAPENYPLLKTPSVFMLPHIGVSSVENLNRIEEEIVSILTNHKQDIHYE